MELKELLKICSEGCIYLYKGNETIMLVAMKTGGYCVLVGIDEEEIGANEKYGECEVEHIYVNEDESLAICLK
ncbi:hypothetical protein [Clostridium frigidicarnis]|uniref:Uncharacterized protein n=1 Tax=Clostridium frigidicarnis TaxID=84698 RepID=A0A1I0V2G6_9CLOT|nr:hypothetical protein [Clostridium frigidicarnis]SFA70442.1 hypothetical protein SAMN04488528_1001108 [Clostridium frigidicarnis]